MTMPKVSVIIPTLNSGRYLEECLDSVCGQTMKQIEIICVDAGSKDETERIIDRYAQKDKRIKKILSEVKSYGYQINMGIKNACGEYIGVVESDDYIMPNMYENLYKKAEGKQIDFVKGGFTQFGFVNGKQIFWESLKRGNKIEEVIDLNENPEYRLFDPGHICTGIYRKEFLIQNQLYLHESPGAAYQDTSYSILVGIFAENCIYTSEKGYYYRIDNEQSSVKSQEKISCIQDEYKYIKEFLTKKNKYIPEIIQMVENYKLITYLWNFNRLSCAGKRIFLKNIEKEMEIYKKEGSSFLGEDQKNIAAILSSELAAKEYVRKSVLETEQWEKFWKIVYQKNKVVLVSAGEYSIRLQALLKSLQIDGVKAVCDNDSALWNVKEGIFPIISVEEAAKKFVGNYFAITNKRHAEELKSQLQQLNIEPERIILLCSMPNLSNMIKIFQKTGII